MKKAKRFSVLVISAIMSISALTAMAPGASAEWVKFKDGSYGYRDEQKNQLTGWQTISKGRYYFDKNGKALTGWYKIGGKKYYFDPENKGKAYANTFCTVDKNKYYFGKDGAVQTGWQTINGKTYYFAADGHMYTGKIKINGKTYDLGTDGVLKGTSSGVDVNEPMSGLSWGMTRSQVMSQKGVTSKNIFELDDGSMAIGKDNSGKYLDPNIGYTFGKKGLYRYSVYYIDTFPGCDVICSSLENDGWTYVSYNNGTYGYAKGNLLAIVMEGTEKGAGGFSVMNTAYESSNDMVFTELDGLSWGMSLSEVKKAKGFTDKQMTDLGSMVMFDTSDTTYYFSFNDDGELYHCGFSVKYSVSKSVSLRDKLEDAGFEYDDISYDEKYNTIDYSYYYNKNGTIMTATVSVDYDTILVSIMHS